MKVEVFTMPQAGKELEFASLRCRPRDNSTMLKADFKNFEHWEIAAEVKRVALNEEQTAKPSLSWQPRLCLFFFCATRVGNRTP